MTRRLALALLVLGAVTTAWAQQPLTSPIYYLGTSSNLVEGEPSVGELTTSSGQNFRDGSYVEVLMLRSAGEETVVVRLESEEFEPYLSLFSPDGELIEMRSATFDGAGYAARIRAYLPTAGAYVVVVSGATSFDVGRYVVTRSAYEAPPKVVVDAVLPGFYEGYLNEEMADMYWLTLTEPTSVVATLRSDAFDTVLEVYGSDGRQVASNDDFDGTDSQIVVDLEPGRYEFLAKGYWAEATGAYTLAFDVYEAAPIVVVEVGRPGSIDGWLASGAADTYVLTLSAPATVTVDVRSSDFDTYLDAYDANGDWIAANDDHDGTDSRLTLDLGAGTYEFDVTAFGGFSSGAYTIEFAW